MDKGWIVEIIRTPADFNQKLMWDSMRDQRKKFDESPELQKAMEISLREVQKRHERNLATQLLLLSVPDEYIKKTFEENSLARGDGYTVDEFIQYVHELREQDPNFLSPVGPGGISGQLHMPPTSGQKLIVFDLRNADSPCIGFMSV